MQMSIVEPLLLFCAHAIRMHDGRCCSVVLRVFRSIIPEFHETERAAGPDVKDSAAAGGAAEATDHVAIPAETARAIREFISSDVLKACITSLHEPYFVDLQKDLGSLIGCILVYYCPLTATPRDVLVSLPNIKRQDVDMTIDYVSRPGLNSRQQRALVLDLLKDLKGVSISEMGKLNKTAGLRAEGSRANRRSGRTKMAQEFMAEPVAAPMTTDGRGDAAQAAPPATRQSPDLEGVAGLFNAAQ